jgi:lipopolysaccharide export system permease protein
VRLIDRYLTKSFLWALGYCVLFFYILFVTVDSFNNLDEFIQHKAAVSLLAVYYAHLLPVMLVQIAPASALVALLFILGNLNKHNEITALRASGVSNFHILFPYLFVGLLMSVGMLLLNEVVVPKAAVTSTAIMDGLIKKGKSNLEEQAIKNVTLYANDHRMIFAREFEVLTNTLHDVVILEDDPRKVVQSKITAKKAKYDGSEWTMYGVMRYDLNRRGNIIGEPAFFDEQKLSIQEKPDDFIREPSQVEFMSARELRQYISQMKGTSKRLLDRLWVDFYHKISFPFVALVVVLIAAPIATRPERGGAIVGVGTALLIVILYYGLDSVCVALGRGGLLPPFIAAWFSNVFFACIGIYLIRNSA